MIVHVFDDTPHHYLGMRDFLLASNNKVNQSFLVKKTNSPSLSDKLKQADILQYKDVPDLKRRLEAYPKYTQFVLHGLFDPHAWLMLLKSKATSRCSYVFWGADVYRHKITAPSIKQRLIRALYTLVCFRFKRVVALNEGDAKLIEKLLKRKRIEVLPYPLIGVDESIIEGKEQKKGASHLKILVGNSAARSNRHEYAFEKLAHLKGEDIEIVVPLNYAGEHDYVQRVIAQGTKVFGSKFKPITQMMEKAEYNALLNDMDMTVFAQERQQGLYVVYAMFLMAKPIFLLSSTTSFDSLTSLGFRIEKTESLSEHTIEELKLINTDKQLNNRELMRSNFSEYALSPRWSGFMEDIA